MIPDILTSGLTSGRARRRRRQGQLLWRRHGPASVAWRRRVAIFGGGAAVGLVAIVFARAADTASDVFAGWIASLPWLPLVLTPVGYAAIVFLTLYAAPAAAGSGIPQIIAAKDDPEQALGGLASARTAAAKMLLTMGGLACGASVGREGPTVQVGATVMAYAHRLLRVPIRSSVLVAGAAAGVAAAFNTPLAGVAFAIEELAAAYEQRMTLLVMTAVLIAGMVSLGVAGDYVYFGIVGQTLSLPQTLILAPVAGIAGGVAGALFSRLALWLLRGGGLRWTRLKPVPFAAACGLIVALIGIVSGTTWGTGYGAARDAIAGAPASVWFGPAKFAATLLTAAAGLPGGIFAPTLATGAGLGEALHTLFPGQPVGALVLLGMVAYFTGVVRAPLTAVIIIAETTGSRGLMLPLLAAALLSEGTASLITQERLYHGLAQRYRRPPKDVPGVEGDRA